MLLPVLSSIADRVAALRAGGDAAGRRAPLLRGPARLGRRPAPRRDGRGAAARPHRRAAKPALAPAVRLDRPAADQPADAAARAGRPAAGLPRAAARISTAGGAVPPAPLAFRAGRPPPPCGIATTRMALLSALAAALAVLLACAFWIAAGWPDGRRRGRDGRGRLLLLRRPGRPGAGHRAVPDLVRASRWSSSASICSRMLPLAHDFPMLVLALAPAFLLFGVLIAHAATTPIGWRWPPTAPRCWPAEHLQRRFRRPSSTRRSPSCSAWRSAAVVTRLVRSVGAGMERAAAAAGRAGPTWPRRAAAARRAATGRVRRADAGPDRPARAAARRGRAGQRARGARRCWPTARRPQHRRPAPRPARPAATPARARIDAVLDALAAALSRPARRRRRSTRRGAAAPDRRGARRGRRGRGRSRPARRRCSAWSASAAACSPTRRLPAPAGRSQAAA